MTLLTAAQSHSPNSPAPDQPGDHPAHPVGPAVRELRLALVCDGGVSLAIYMHGVTKELQNLVCAARLHDEYLAAPQDEAKIRRELTETQIAYFDALEASEVPLTVTIDVISGTSAGGINGVCLAKGLAQNLSPEPLTNLWIDNGDLVKLAHRRLPGNIGAIIGTALAVLRKAFNPAGWSPLDGDLMSSWLLGAMAEMDNQPSLPGRRSLLPDGRDLDLFVTSTDLRGYRRRFSSQDGRQAEQAITNRKVFHFNSGAAGPGGRFGTSDNPALAFAARCTSSFPGAFAPTSIADFARIVKSTGMAPVDVRAFVDDQLAEYPLAGVDAESVYFADGGLLDNSPFDHAVAAIARKSAQGQVDRFILHIDPDPGDFVEPDPASPVMSEAATWAGGLKTALGVRSAQSSFSDLLDVERMNDTIAGVGSITAALQGLVDEELAMHAAGFAEQEFTWDNAKAWNAAVNQRVPAVAGTLNQVTYRRLKVDSIAQMFAMDLSDALQYPADSQQAAFLRQLFTGWFAREEFWSNLPNDALDRFLQAADLPYRERRLRFLVAKINDLYNDPADYPARTLGNLKSEGWRRIGALLNFRAETAAFLRPLAASFLAADQLRELATRPDTLEFPPALAAQLQQLVDAYTTRLAAYGAGDSAKDLYEYFVASSGDLPAIVRTQLLGRYIGFPLWDILIYPVIALSKLPQLSPIQLRRFSPRDANLLHPIAGPGAPKLKGASLKHFGGFFDKGWRENDYLWGRLDAAEQILGLLGQTQRTGPGNLYSVAVNQIATREKQRLSTAEKLLEHLQQQV